MVSNRRYGRQQGATLVEFTITFMVFLILVLAIIEFSLVIFGASRLAEATRAGARYAIVNNPACNIFGRDSSDADSGCTPNNHPLDCETNPVDSVSVVISSCTFPAATPGCKLVGLMDQMMLRKPENSILAEGGSVQITYTCSNTGDPSIPIMIPEVTVAAENIQHPMMFASIFGFYSEGGSTLGPSITLPNFQTTRTGEDMFNR